MLHLKELQSLSNAAKSEFLRKNLPVNLISIAKRKIVFGFGINDSDYIVRPKIEGVQVSCAAYATWANMLKRAYSPKSHQKQPTYISVTVCKEWRSFMSFRDWWLENQVDGYALDKDLLSDSREYGPKSCIFIPQWLNNFTNDHASARGNFPIGVYWHKPAEKYRARCSNPFGRQEHLGLFSCANDAHAAWKLRKLEMAAEIRPRMDAIDMRIYPRVVEIIKNAT